MWFLVQVAGPHLLVSLEAGLWFRILLTASEWISQIFWALHLPCPSLSAVVYDQFLWVLHSIWKERVQWVMLCPDRPLPHKLKIVFNIPNNSYCRVLVCLPLCSHGKLGPAACCRWPNMVRKYHSLYIISWEKIKIQNLKVLQIAYSFPNHCEVEKF